MACHRARRRRAGFCELRFRVGVGWLGVYRVDEVGEVGCRFGAHAGEHVLVGGHGEPGVCVAEALGHDLDRNSVRDEQRCVGVAQIVQSDSRQSGAGNDAGEQLADRLCVQWLASVVGEDGIVAARAVAVAMLARAPCS